MKHGNPRERRAKKRTEQSQSHVPQSQVVRNGSHRGQQRYVCNTCKTFFGETQGTPMYGLKIPEAEVAQVLLIVMRRGSLRARGPGHR